MLILLLVFVFLIIILIDLRGLLKTGHRIKRMVIYFFLLTAAFVTALLQIIDKAPTSPTIFIEKIVKLLIPGG